MKRIILLIIFLPLLSFQVNGQTKNTNQLLLEECLDKNKPSIQFQRNSLPSLSEVTTQGNVDRNVVVQYQRTDPGNQKNGNLNPPVTCATTCAAIATNGCGNYPCYTNQTSANYANSPGGPLFVTARANASVGWSGNGSLVGCNVYGDLTTFTGGLPVDGNQSYTHCSEWTATLPGANFPTFMGVVGFTLPICVGTTTVAVYDNNCSNVNGVGGVVVRQTNQALNNTAASVRGLTIGNTYKVCHTIDWGAATWESGNSGPGIPCAVEAGDLLYEHCMNISEVGSVCDQLYSFTANDICSGQGSSWTQNAGCKAGQRTDTDLNFFLYAPGGVPSVAPAGYDPMMGNIYIDSFPLSNVNPDLIWDGALGQPWGTSICQSTRTGTAIITFNGCAPVNVTYFVVPWDRDYDSAGDGSFGEYYQGPNSCVIQRYESTLYPAALSVAVIDDGSGCGTPEVQLQTGAGAACVTFTANQACTVNGTTINYDFSTTSTVLGLANAPAACALPTVLSGSITCSGCADCNSLIASGTNICTIIVNGSGQLDPNHILANEDCDNGGVSNYIECLNGENPNEPSDDCQAAFDAGINICIIIAGNQSHPMAQLDCDGGGVSNILECITGKDPSNPGDDCQAAFDNNLNICALIGGNQNHPMAMLDCDNGGVNNYTECINGEDPSDPTDDCQAAFNAGTNICTIISGNQNHPMAALDCDGGGIDNYTECITGEDPSDPGDDCTSALDGSINICLVIGNNQAHPLASLDCDDGGVDNYTECINGEDPSDPLDDCQSAFDEGTNICFLIAGNPNHPMATLDCDGGGVDNITECSTGEDPSNPTDDCQSVIDGPNTICGIIAGNPTHPLANVDCDGDGVTNITECVDSTDPEDPCDYDDGSITLPVTADQSGCPVQCPDLTPIVSILPGNISGVSFVGVAIEITELNQFDTDGSAINVRIPSDPRLTFSWDPTLTFVALTIVDNPSWSYVGDNGLVHTFKYAGVLNAGTRTALGFSGSYDPQATTGQTTITASVVPLSGGECVFSNNSDSEILVYFD